MIERIDFTSCRRLLGKAYNGANGKKIAVEYEGRQYMLKFPPSGAQKPTDLSYTNSCISEHLGSSIFNMLGIPAQQTLLGVFTVSGKEKVVCACGDFTADGKTLYDFCSIKNTVIDSEHGGSGTELSDILESIEKQQFVNPGKLLEHFWNVFVVDALLGNFDRHNGNWGFLYNSQTDTAEIAPIFDCGSCLLPQADEKVMRNVLTNEDDLNARIYRFPTSAIKMGGQKVNYYDFLMSGEYADCNEAIVRINAYYKSLAGSSTRATIFKTHLSYSTVESMVLSELGKTLNQVKSAYPDTYDFLMSLKDGLSEIDHY